MSDEIFTSTSFYNGAGKVAFRPDFDPSRYKTNVEDVATTVVWGRAGANPFAETFVQSLESTEEREIRRTFDVVRVKDPDNEDNHVDVEVLTEWEGRTKIGNKRIKMVLEKPRSSDNVEILQRGQTRSSST